MSIPAGPTPGEPPKQPPPSHEQEKLDQAGLSEQVHAGLLGGNVRQAAAQSRVVGALQRLGQVASPSRTFRLLALMFAGLSTIGAFVANAIPLNAVHVAIHGETTATQLELAHDVALQLRGEGARLS